MELETDAMLEDLSVMIRFVCNGIQEEQLIGMLDLSQLNAEFITNQIIQHLSDSGYRADDIISQCYDGAAVMGGIRKVFRPCCKRR